MLKIFENQSEKWSTKTNFVDSTNVVVGYDTSQQCCENCDHYFLTEEPTVFNTSDGNHTLPENLCEILNFDPSYFKEIPAGGYSEGNAVVFKLVGDIQPRYLVIFNSHNGYYSHGFTVDIGGQNTRSGSI